MIEENKLIQHPVTSPGMARHSIHSAGVDCTDMPVRRVTTDSNKVVLPIRQTCTQFETPEPQQSVGSDKFFCWDMQPRFVMLVVIVCSAPTILGTQFK